MVLLIFLRSRIALCLFMALGPVVWANAERTTTSTTAPTEQLHRLIIKFKAASGVPGNTSASTDRASPSSAPSDPRERVDTLNRTHAHSSSTPLSTAETFSYIKSITAQAHVVVTSRNHDRKSMEALVQTLSQDPNIEYAEIDERVFPHFVPNDLYFSAQQWNLKAPSVEVAGSNFVEAWDRQTASTAPVRGTGVVVAVLDTGYRPHSDLNSNILPGYDFVSADAIGVYTTANDSSGWDSDAYDPGDGNNNSSACKVEPSSWHGTRVAGIIAAIGDNLEGIAGAAFGAKILPVRVLGVCGGYVSDVAAGMRWAAGVSIPSTLVGINTAPGTNPNPAKVLNVSLGSLQNCSQTYQEAVTAVRGQGSVVVASTGNDGETKQISQPANCPGVIAVTGHMRSGDSPQFANVGAGTTLSAPAVNIYSTSNTGVDGPIGDNYDAQSGTSFAAPQVAAAAALLFQIKPTITPDELMSRLVNAVRPFPTSTYCTNKYTCGAGMLDAQNAVDAVLADSAPIAQAYADAIHNVAVGTGIHLTGISAPGSSGGPIASVEWTQVAGPTVTLAGSTSNNASFTVPASAVGTTLSFRFRATSTLSESAESLVVIDIAPPPASSGGGGGGGAFDLVTSVLLLTTLSGSLFVRVARRKKHGM